MMPQEWLIKCERALPMLSRGQGATREPAVEGELLRAALAEKAGRLCAIEKLLRVAEVASES